MRADTPSMWRLIACIFMMALPDGKTPAWARNGTGHASAPDPLSRPVMRSASQQVAHAAGGARSATVLVGNAQLRISQERGTNAAVAGELSAPDRVRPGEAFTATVVVQNTGTATWRAGQHALGAAEPQDNTRWGVGRAPLAGDVAPGQWATISLRLVAPAAPGTHRLAWRMIQEYVEWFGPVLAKNVAVAAP